MKYCLTAFYIMFATFAPAQNRAEKQVAAAVETLRQAMISGDRAALQPLVAEALSYGHSSGKVESRAVFVEALASGQSDFVEINLTDQTITVSSKTAIVRHRLAAKTNDAGKGPGTVNLAVMLVWVKENRAWKLLARQAVKG